jgi:hypothetical protein
MRAVVVDTWIPDIGCVVIVPLSCARVLLLVFDILGQALVSAAATS